MLVENYQSRYTSDLEAAFQKDLDVCHPYYTEPVRTVILETQFRALSFDLISRKTTAFYMQKAIARFTRFKTPTLVTANMIKHLAERTFQAFQGFYPYPLDHLCMWVNVKLSRKFVLFPKEFAPYQHLPDRKKIVSARLGVSEDLVAIAIPARSVYDWSSELLNPGHFLFSMAFEPSIESLKGLALKITPDLIHIENEDLRKLLPLRTYFKCLQPLIKTFEKHLLARSSEPLLVRSLYLNATFEASYLSATETTSKREFNARSVSCAIRTITEVPAVDQIISLVENVFNQFHQHCKSYDTFSVTASLSVYKPYVITAEELVGRYGGRSNWKELAAEDTSLSTDQVCLKGTDHIELRTALNLVTFS